MINFRMEPLSHIFRLSDLKQIFDFDLRYECTKHLKNLARLGQRKLLLSMFHFEDYLR